METRSQGDHGATFALLQAARCKRDGLKKAGVFKTRPHESRRNELGLGKPWFRCGILVDHPTPSKPLSKMCLLKQEELLAHCKMPWVGRSVEVPAGIRSTLQYLTIICLFLAQFLHPLSSKWMRELWMFLECEGCLLFPGALAENECESIILQLMFQNLGLRARLGIKYFLQPSDHPRRIPRTALNEWNCVFEFYFF